MILVIDNTSTPGTFFDNIHNPNWVVNEYELNNVEEVENFRDEINKSSKVYIKDGDIPYVTNEEVISPLKYDYITEKNVNEFRTPYYDKVFETINNSFILSKDQFNSWLHFQDNHIDCRIDKETGRHKFGTNGGGSSLVFQINYCSEEMFPRFGFLGARCDGCGKIDPLTEKFEDDKDLERYYKSHVEYGFKFNLVEFYRFIEIYKEYKSTMDVSFMSFGLGDLISVKVKDFIFSITDNSHW